MFSLLGENDAKVDRLHFTVGDSLGNDSRSDRFGRMRPVSTRKLSIDFQLLGWRLPWQMRMLRRLRSSGGRKMWQLYTALAPKRSVRILWWSDGLPFKERPGENGNSFGISFIFFPCFCVSFSNWALEDLVGWEVSKGDCGRGMNLIGLFMFGKCQQFTRLDLVNPWRWVSCALLLFNWFVITFHRR